MELRQLKYFLKASELLNFTAAAEELFISQSTLSQQIKQLEIELGISLFDRIGKRIILTEAGKKFSFHARKSIESSKEGFLAMQDLIGLKSGTLKIGVSYGLRFTLLPALKKFSLRYPSIHLQITFDTTKKLLNLLEKSQLDFILSFQDENTNNNLNYDPLFTSQMSFVTSELNQLNLKEIKLKDIIKYPLVMPSKGYSTTNFILEAFNQLNLEPKIAIEVNDIPSLIEIVKLGQWHTILAQTTISSEENLTVIPIKEKNMNRNAVIITQKEAYKTQAMQKFVSILKNLTTKNN